LFSHMVFCVQDLPRFRSSCASEGSGHLYEPRIYARGPGTQAAPIFDHAQNFTCLMSFFVPQYYIGLNGIELYDEAGKLVRLAPRNITACPSSLNELADVQARGGGDVRVPENLVNGENNTFEPVRKPFES